MKTQLKNIIEDYPNYKIYENGEIFNIKRNKLKKACLTKNGYLRIGLSNNNKSKTFLLHRLIGLNFIPNPNNLPEINHIDGNKLHCHKNNLEWCTSSDNQKHAFTLGLQSQKGDKNNSAKLNLIKVKQIRDLYSKGIKVKTLVKEFNVNQSTITRIINYKIWNYAR